ncbi:HisA/HisF-related TIM barrel protein [Blastococcus brunescens]|uniref:HisA/HisF-related TIM barrel protein n=1 Tax=Blastococcus brunescens TaxID=1564165 RepID=A0ABZ1BAG0_9ACTN|nr:HisA/HisF-related TIM barrel protein [Blastococcus sp. BMG 8361]WRL66948.1 HisA/HisF-related TIM barrel protein [Blastococcus sp. BMG 8361]
MDADGTRTGFDTELIRQVRREVRVPLIASGERAPPSTSRLPSRPAPTRSWPRASSTSVCCGSVRSRTPSPRPACPSATRRTPRWVDPPRRRS